MTTFILASPLKLRSSRFKGNGAEGERWRPLDHELQINPVVRKLQEIDFLKRPLEFTNEVRGIFSANSEVRGPFHSAADGCSFCSLSCQRNVPRSRESMAALMPTAGT
jgi:hypothetical protein